MPTGSYISKHLLFLALIAALFGIATSVVEGATTLTWTGGGGDNNIGNAANWSPAQAPASGDTLLFSGVTSLAPTLSAPLTVQSLTFSTTAAFALSGSTYTINGGITNSGTGTETIGNAIALGATQTWTASSPAAGLNLTAAVSLGTRVLTLSGSGSILIAGNINGTGQVKIKGPGKMTLSGSNSYSGKTTLSGGTLLIGSNYAAGTGVLSLGTGSIDTTGSAQSLSNAVTLAGNTSFLGSNNLTLSGPVTISANRSLTLSGAGMLIFSSVLSGSGGLTEKGTGTLVLLGTNAFGNFTLSAGTVEIATNTSLGTATVSLGSGVLEGDGSGPKTLGNALTISGNPTFAGADSLTFTGSASLTGSRMLTVNASNVTLNDVISGSAYGITESGTGTLTLSGAFANTFAGVTTLDGGTLVLNKSAGVNAIGGSISVGDNSGGAATSVAQWDAASQIASSATITVNTDGEVNLQSFSQTIAGLTMNGGSVIGTGLLTLSGGLTVTGPSTVPAVISANLALSGASAFAINDNSPTQPDLTISGVISNGASAGSLVMSGSGMLALNGSNTYTGGTVLNAGTVYAGTDTAFGVGNLSLGGVTLASSGGARVFANPLTLAGNASFSGSGNLTFTGGASLNGNRILTVNNGAVTFSGAITQDVAGRTLTKAGPGVLTLSGSSANTITGAATVNAGTLVLAKISGLALGGDLVINSGTVQLQGAGELANSSNVTVSSSGVFDLNGNSQAIASLTVSGGASVTTGTGTLTTGPNITHDGTGSISASIVGNLNLGGTACTFTVGQSSALVDLAVPAVISNGALTKAGLGLLNLSSANTYTGATTIGAGTLQLGAVNAIGNSSAVSAAAGATFDLNSFSDAVASLSGSGAVLLGTGTLTLGGSSSTSFAGTISGSGPIVKNGSGIFTLSGTDSHTGATTINAGTWQFGATNAAPSGSAFTLAGGAALALNGFAESIGSLAGSGSVMLGNGTLTLGGNNLSTTYSGVISGAGGLTMSGTGTLTITNAGTLTGAVQINTGNLTLTGSTGALASASGFTLGTGATLTLDNSAGANNARLAGNASISLDGGAFSLVSSSNGTSETVGALNVLGGVSTVSITLGGTSSTLTFSSLGTVANDASVNFAGIGGTLGSGGGPQIYILGQPNGLMGGWATVGSSFAEYYANGGGVQAFSNYYMGSDGINVNDPTQTILLSGSSPATASTLTNAGTTSDSGLNISDLSGVSLGTASTQVLNLVGGGLIKSSTAVASTTTTISGQGLLTASGTASGALSVTVNAGNTLAISSSIINNAGPDGVYGNADDGAVSLVKAGSGSLVLSGSNSFGGGVYINAGALYISAESNLGASGNGVIFNSGTLNVTAGFAASTAKVFTVSAGMTGTLDISPGQTLTLGNVANVLVSGSSNSVLYKNDTGALVVQNSNASFIGTVQINAGAVELDNSQSLGGGIVLNSGTLRLRNDANTNFANAVSLIADSTIDAERMSGPGSAVLTLNSLSIGGNTLTVTGTTGASLAFNAVTLSGSATFNTASANLALSSVSGAYSLIKTGTGTLTLNGTNSFTGATSISTGIMRLGGANATAPASTVAISSGATFDLNGYSTKVAGLTGSGSLLLGSGTLAAAITQSGTFSGIISGSGGLTKSGAATLTLSGTNTYSGPTLVNGGTLQLGAVNGLASSTSLSVASGGVFDLNGFSDSIAGLSGSGAVTLGTGTLTIGNSSTTFSGSISGSGGLVKSGGGTLVLNGANSFSGSAMVNAGVLDLENSSALSSAGAGLIAGSGGEIQPGVSMGAVPLTLSGTGTTGAGALHDLAATVAWAGPISLAANSTIGADAGTLTLSGAITTGSNLLTITGSGNITITGAITGSAGLAKNGSGTLTLGGSNLFTGTTTVSGGVLSVQKAAALGGSGNTANISAGAAMQLSSADGISVKGVSLTLSGSGIGGSGVFVNTAGNNTWTGKVTMASDVPISVTQGSLNVTGVIGESGGSRALIKSGAGILVLSGSETYSGATVLNSGTLQLGISGALPSNSTMTIAAGATFAMSDMDQTIGSLAGAGTVDSGNVSGGDLTVGANNSSTTFSGNFLGLGDLIKTGTGTFTLTGTGSTFSGDTYLNAGVLAIDSDARLGATGGTIYFEGGALQATGTFTSARAVSLDSTALIDTNGNFVTLSGTLASTAGLTKIGAGTLILSGSNTYAGPVAINNGTLSITNAATGASAQALGEDSADPVTLGVAGASSGILQYTGGAAVLDRSITALGNGSDTIQNAGTGLLTLSGTLTNNGTALTLNGGSYGIAVSGQITGTGSGSNLIVTGGTTTLSVADGDSGRTYIYGGGALLNALSGGVLPSGTVLTLGESGSNSSGLFDLDGNSQTVAGLNTSGTGSANIITNSGAAAATLVVTTSGTFAGTIQNGSKAVALTVSGGSFKLAGNNTYTGATNITGGTLIVSGSLGGTSATVAAGAILASGNNTGSAVSNGGSNTLAVYGTLSPGGSGGGGLSSVGLLSTGALTLGASGTTAHFVMELGGTAAGTGYDEVAVRGGTTLTLSNVKLDGSLINGFLPAVATFNISTHQDNLDGAKFFLVIGAGSVSGTFANQLAPDPNLTGYNTVDFGGHEFAISYTANAGTNSFTGGHDIAVMALIPEPSPLELLACAIGVQIVIARLRKGTRT